MAKNRHVAGLSMGFGRQWHRAGTEHETVAGNEHVVGAEARTGMGIEMDISLYVFVKKIS